MSEGMTRREFLHKGLTLVAVAATAPSFLARSALAMNDPFDLPQVTSRPGVPDERILVVVQLGGGNDGLNTVVPFADDTYYRVRPRLAIPRDRVIRLTDELGLHPRMQKFKELYDQGLVAVIQGVGYPNPNRSHFKSMEIWHTADPDGRLRVGWIGRYFDSQCPACEQPTVGVNVGPTLPLAMRGERGQGITLEAPETFRWVPLPGNLPPKEQLELFKLLNTPPAGSPGPVDFLSRTAMNAVVASDRVREAVQRYRGGVEYPNHRFARSLRLIAQLIAGHLPTKVYYAHLTGFDTHAGQQGRHDELLEQLSTGLAAFYRDLEAQGNAERVLVMAFSEFGRRVAENASGGTDHGAAAPVFVFGRAVRPGLHGRHPSLTDLQDGDLKHHVDFRAVYATLLERWLGTDPVRVLGGQFERVPFLA